MVQSGMAWAHKKYVRNPVYIQAQQNAKRKEVGLWQDKNPIPPEQWRKQQGYYMKINTMPFDNVKFRQQFRIFQQKIRLFI